MISTFKNKVSGGFLITAYYRQGEKPMFYNRLTSDETRADNLIKQIKKEVLREKVSRFLNHRKNIMENHGGLSTQEKFAAINTLVNNLSFLEKHSLESNCSFILKSHKLFESIMPGKTSTFYENAMASISEIFTFCFHQTTIKS